MIPGGFSPTDRPMTEHELHPGNPQLDRRANRSNARATWIMLVSIVLLIAAVIILLSYMPDA